MSDKTSIQWTDATWNVITGCSRVSPGCINCYAEALAGSRLRNHPSRAGLTKYSNGRETWTGEVRFNEPWLDQPLRWKRGRRIFVCAHGDLFHENVPDEWIDRVFHVMAMAPQHTFQVLTKRAERMRRYLADAEMQVRDAVKYEPIAEALQWPLPNVHLGVSLEDQQRASERLHHLLATPAAARWVSYEPALGPVNFLAVGTGEMGLAPWRNVLTGCGVGADGSNVQQLDRHLDWVIVGGESGRDARPFDIAWARNTVEQCKVAGVACFVKQLGKVPFADDPDSHNQLLMLRDSHGGDWDEWPKDLRVREFPR